MSATAFYNETEYSCGLQARFAEHGNRLFLVDYAKSCAAEALLSLVTAARRSYQSFLLIVKNGEVAEAFRSLLTPTLGEMTVIDTENALRQALGNTEQQAAILRANAAQWRQNHKNLIVVQSVAGAPVLHRILADDDAKNLSCPGAFCGCFTVADLLAEAQYDFVAIDDVLSHFSLEEEDRNKSGAHDAGSYEKIHFCGRNYYVSTKTSYKKLHAIAAGAKGCVALSDTVIEKDACELFAVLDLLYGGFSKIDVRAAVRPVAEAFTDGITAGYDGACDMVFNALAYARDDFGIVSACLSKVSAHRKNAPRDIDAMRSFLADEMAYTSQEELFLRLMHAKMLQSGNGEYPTVEAVIGEMVGDSDAAADCFVQLFFQNKIQNELEHALDTTAACAMTPEESAALLRTFMRYGACHRVYINPERTKIWRLKREDNGFEYFARRYAKSETKESPCFVTLGRYDDDSCKCMAVRQLANADRASLLILVNRSTEKRQERLRAALSGYTVGAQNQTESDADTQKLATVMSLDAFRATPTAKQFGAVVFFDCPDNPLSAKRLVAKAQRVATGNVYLLATYGDMSGTFMDCWQTDCTAPDTLLPFACDEIALKHGVHVPFSAIIKRINEVYETLFAAVTGRSPEKITALPAAINELVITYGETPSFPRERMELDLTYAAKLGQHFDDVFGNTASVSGDGETLVGCPLDYNPNKSTDKTENKPAALFNVCPKLLRRTCDLKRNDCADCKDYKTFMTNDFDTLAKSTEAFFALAEEYVVQKADLKYKLAIDDIIHGSDDEDSVRLTENDVAERKTSALHALENLENAKNHMSHMFHGDYDDVRCLREAVYQVYRAVLRQYFKAVMLIFRNANAAVKQQLDNMRRAVDMCNQA